MVPEEMAHVNKMHVVYFEQHGDPQKVISVIECNIPEPGDDEILVQILATPVSRCALSIVGGEVPVRIEAPSLSPRLLRCHSSPGLSRTPSTPAITITAPEETGSSPSTVPVDPNSIAAAPPRVHFAEVAEESPVHRVEQSKHVLNTKVYGGLKISNIPGNEAVGRIVALGKHVQGFTLDQRVIVAAPSGLWSEYIVASPAAFMEVPPQLDDASACQLFVTPLTALCLISMLRPQKGKYLLQSGASSAVGQLVIQLSKLHGFKTLNVVRRWEQVKKLMDMGADEVISIDRENVVKRVKELTRGEGVAYALDAIGGSLGAAMGQCMAKNSTLVFYGTLCGDRTSCLDVQSLISKSVTIKGFNLNQWLETTPRQEIEASIDSIVQLLMRGAIKLPVETAYSFRDVKRAITHALTSGNEGRVILVTQEMHLKTIA
jgi:NADPH:quinone reductase-like Zn-dependent oxidoreductase